jgi:pilus assembly protein CpaF
MSRLETLATMSELNLPVATIRDQINSAIDIVVHLERGIDGTRRVAEVAALTSSRREEYEVVPLAHFRSDPIGPDRKVTGRFVLHAVPEALRERLFRAGESIPSGVPAS